MITATINGVALDLPRDFQIDLTSQSQILSFDKLAGDVVPSVSFPDTENNRNLLRHPNRFETKRTGLTEFSNFELRADGYLLIAGKLVLDNGFTGYIAGGTGVLAASQEDKLVTDYQLPTNQVFDNKISYSPETDDYCAPAIVNPDFYKDLGVTATFTIWSTDQEMSYLQRHHRTTSYAVNYREAGLVLFPTESIYATIYTDGLKINPVSPFVYYFNAIKKLLKINGFHELFNDFSTHDFMSLCVYNNFSISDLSPLLIDDSFQDWNPLGGYITNIREFGGYGQSQRNFNFTNLLPRISLKEFLLMPQNMLNFATVFSGNRYAILDREGVMASDPIDIDAYFMGEWTLKGKENNLVKFSVATDANDYYFGTFYQDLDEREADFIADVNTAAEMQAITPAVGALCRVLQEQRIYEYNTHVITAEDGSEVESIGWHFVSIDFHPLKYNKNATNTDTIEINAAGTLPFAGAGQVRQPGKVSLRKDTEADFALRLLFDDANIGKNNKGDYTLNFRYTNNLIERRWSRTARFLANREEVEGYFRFPAILLSQIASDLRSPRNLNRTRFRTRHGVFVISKMVTRVNHSGILESKVTAYKV